MSRPKITFVMPAHNHGARVLKTLSLLWASLGRLAHEVIVVDNDSTDDMARLVAQRFPRTRVIELSTDHDGAARNVALAAAEADFVFMLDDGLWPDKGTTEFALRMMAERPRLAAATCNVRRLGEALRPEPNKPAGVFASSGVVLRRQAIIEVGGYPIDSADSGEQYDLCARLWQAGWQVQRFEPMVAWREPDIDKCDANAILKTVTASSLRFWSRYAPESQYQSLLDETIEGCRQLAQKESAMAGYQEGLALGLDAAQGNRSRRKPLTEEQLNSLLGSNQPQPCLQQTPAA